MALVLPDPQDQACAGAAWGGTVLFSHWRTTERKVSKPGPIPKRWLPYLHSEGEDSGSGAVPAHSLVDSIKFISIGQC